MTLKEKIKKLSEELEGWKTARKNYIEDPSKFVKGYIDGRIVSLEYALEILENK